MVLGLSLRLTGVSIHVTFVTLLSQLMAYAGADQHEQSCHVFQVLTHLHHIWEAEPMQEAACRRRALAQHSGVRLATCDWCRIPPQVSAGISQSTLLQECIQQVMLQLQAAQHKLPEKYNTDAALEPCQVQHVGCSHQLSELST